MKRLILASASPRRAGLMRAIGLDFEQLPIGMEESLDSGEDHYQAAVRLAREKARAASAVTCGEALIIGADTVVVLDDMIIGKPGSNEDARQILASLSGRRHLVVTGLCLVDKQSERAYSGFEETRVRFRDILDYEIDAYVASGECQDKAGAYGIQGRGALLIEAIEGCYYNVVGLPLNLLRRLMLEAGQDIWRALK